MFVVFSFSVEDDDIEPDDVAIYAENTAQSNQLDASTSYTFDDRDNYDFNAGLQRLVVILLQNDNFATTQ